MTRSKFWDRLRGSTSGRIYVNEINETGVFASRKQIRNNAIKPNVSLIEMEGLGREQVRLLRADFNQQLLSDNEKFRFIPVKRKRDGTFIPLRCPPAPSNMEAPSPQVMAESSSSAPAEREPLPLNEGSKLTGPAEASKVFQPSEKGVAGRLYARFGKGVLPTGYFAPFSDIPNTGRYGDILPMNYLLYHSNAPKVDEIGMQQLWKKDRLLHEPSFYKRNLGEAYLPVVYDPISRVIYDPLIHADGGKIYGVPVFDKLPPASVRNAPSSENLQQVLTTAQSDRVSVGRRVLRRVFDFTSKVR